MSDYTTKKELNKSLDDLEAKLSNKIDEAVTDLSKIIADFAQMVDTRFNKIESDLLELKLETRQSYSNLVSTVDGFVKRLDDMKLKAVQEIMR